MVASIDLMLKEHWERLTEEAGVGTRAVLDLCGEMGEKVSELARPLATAFASEHGGKETIDKILKNILSLAKKMLETLKG